MNKKVLIIIIVAVVLIGGGVAAYFMLFAGGEEETDAPPTMTYFETGEYIVTNLKNTEKNVLVKLTVVLGVNEETADLELLTANTAVIRDRIVYTMRGHAAEDFYENTSLDTLSDEICQAINTELGIDYVLRAYFYDFVVQ